MAGKVVSLGIFELGVATLSWGGGADRSEMSDMIAYAWE